MPQPMAARRRHLHLVGVLGRPLNETFAGGDSGRVADDHHPDGPPSEIGGLARRERHDRRSLARRRSDVGVGAIAVGHDDDDASDEDTGPGGNRSQRPPTHSAGPHRRLDDVVADRRDGQGDGQTDRQQNDRADVESALVDERVDRPMEQVDAVADPPEPNQRGERQCGADERGPLQPADQRHGRKRKGGQPTSGRRTAGGRPRHRADENHGEANTGDPATCRHPRGSVDEHGEDGAGKDLREPGRCREI